MKINGRKTYLIGTGMIAYGLLGLALGWIDQGSALQLIGNGAGLMGLRHGVSKLGG